MKRFLFLLLLALGACNEADPKPTPTPPWSTGGPLVMTFPSSPPSFYAPTSIEDNKGEYTLLTTNGDRVARYLSNDGKTWTGGDIVLFANANTWEDDGGSFLGYKTGISNPVLIKNVTPNFIYTMYYNAGPVGTATTSGGGLGVAISNDGIAWVKSADNPIRTAVGGAVFALQAMTIAGKRYVFFAAGGDLSKGIGPPLVVAEDSGDGIHLINDRILSDDNDPAKLPGTAVPLLYDEATGKCWMAVGFRTAPPPSGPAGFDIYKDSDCFTTVGTKVATIDPSTTGNPTNFDPQALNRGDKGQRIGSGSDPIQIIFSTGNQWGSWKPAAIIIKP